MILNIRPSGQLAGNPSSSRKTGAPSSTRLGLQKTQDSFNTQKSTQIAFSGQAHPPKFGTKLELTRDIVAKLTESEKALFEACKQAIKDENTKKELTRILLELQNSERRYKWRRSIYDASKQYLHSVDLESNYRTSLAGKIFGSNNDLWSISPC